MGENGLESGKKNKWKGVKKRSKIDLKNDRNVGLKMFKKYVKTCSKE